MGLKAKSQWDFGGELFPSQEMRRVFSVTEVTATVHRLLEERVGTVWVTGEVSNLRAKILLAFRRARRHRPFGLVAAPGICWNPPPSRAG